MTYTVVIYVGVERRKQERTTTSAMSKNALVNEARASGIPDTDIIVVEKE